MEVAIIIDRLIEQIIIKKNPSVVGLDTKLEYVPRWVVDKYGGDKIDFHGAAGAILEFNKAILDTIYEYIPAVKLQIAYYELYGPAGLEAFKATAQYAKEKGLIVIGDIKRNDIGSTAQAYATAYLGETQLGASKARAFDMDFVTVNPYLGSDGVMPFIEICKEFGKGIFILVKTSNPSSGEFQDLTVHNKKLYHIVADKVVDWGRKVVGQSGYSAVGAVVGATYPQQIAELRAQMPSTYFLIPGYGVQGGNLDGILKGFGSNGLGAVVNASRSVICAYQHKPWKEIYKPKDFAEASLAEVLSMRDEIEKGLTRRGIRPW